MTQVTNVPRVILLVDGVAMGEDDSRSLAAVRVQQRLSAPTLCELAFAEPPGPLDAAARLGPGTGLRVEVAEHHQPLFAGEVTAIEHVYDPSRGREVRVRAYDPLHRLRKRQTVRAHVEVTAQELASELTADVGLAVDAAEPGPVLERLFQHRQSDFDLLMDVLANVGLFAFVHDGTLRLLTLEGRGEAVELKRGETLLQARFDVNGDPACRAVVASGWDPFRGEFPRAEASGARSGRRVAAAVDPGSVGGTGELSLVDQGTASEATTRAAAQAELDARTGREVSFWGIAEGDPRLLPGVPVEISDVADPLAGTYILTRADHTIDTERGFVTELSSYPPPPRPRPTGAAVAPAVVESVEDPDKKGRIKVRLPTFEDVETGWMGVVVPAAGADKGLVALPDVGDQVLVAFAQEDPGRGVVLGGLYGDGAPPDDGVDGGAIKRFSFITPGGQKVVLDDGDEKILLENSDGSRIEIAPGRVSLHAATDLTIEAPGKSITIRAAKVDFKKG